MTREGQPFNEYLDSFEESASRRERRIYEEHRAQYAFANLIIERRKALDLTQGDLAELTGISQPEISRIESGKVNPTIGTLGRLADGLKARVGLIEDPDEIPHAG
jgi:DNA-binding XRE family transcriptional regulator